MATAPTITVVIRDLEWGKALFAAAELMAEALQDAVDSANDTSVNGLWQSLHDHIAIEWDTKGIIALAAWKALEVGK